MPSRDVPSQHTDEAGAVCHLAPLDPTSLLNEGNSLCALERFEEAAAIYGVALARAPVASPLRAMLLSNRGMAHLEQQQAEAALTDFAAALAVLAVLPMGPDDAALRADMHQVALAGKVKAQAIRKDSLK
ncbi:MAG: hypothetical protein WCD86_17255 [Ktedonobacteraceae bacterium]